MPKFIKKSLITPLSKQKIEKIEDQLRTNPDVVLEKEQVAQLAKKGDITALADEFESLKTQFTKFDDEDGLAQVLLVSGSSAIVGFFLRGGFGAALY